MLKSTLKHGLVAVVSASTLFLLAGCGETVPTLTSTYDAEREKVSISLTYPESEDYRWSTNPDDFRISANQAILLGPDFKIAIQFADLAVNKYEKDFSKYKENYIAEFDAKDFEIAGLKGFVWYYSGYRAVAVVLPIASSPDNALLLYVYTEESKEEGAMEVFNSDAVQSILRTLKITALAQ